MVERMRRSDCVCIWYAEIGVFLAVSRAIATKKELSMVEKAANVHPDALNKHYEFVDNVVQYDYLSRHTRNPEIKIVCERVEDHPRSIKIPPHIS